MIRTFKGVIFDFNGTLLWDTPLHNRAWDIFLNEHKLQFTNQEKREKIHGKGNKDIFIGIYNNQITDEQIAQYIAEKEAIYRQIVIDQAIELAPGAIAFFEFLKAKHIPFCIATSSGIENVQFFYEHFKLHQWFTWDTIVYDDGSIKGKPHPDIFIKAASAMQLSLSNTIIFEDSIWGIKAAENARAGKIIIVNSNNEDYTKWNHEIITHFNQVNSFKGTGLLEYLQENGITDLVICGMQTHMCLEAATRAAHDFDFNCTVIEDACATRDLTYKDAVIKARDVHYSTLATLKSYAQIIDAQAFLNKE